MDPTGLYLPYEGFSNKPWIRAVVGKGVPIKPIVHGHLKVWELSANHLLPLASAMADRYGEIEMRLQVSPTMTCSHSCQTARPDTVWECVCECGGRHHSGKGTYDDWYSRGRFRIERQGQIEVRYLQIQRGQIPLPPDISLAALERALPISPPQAPPARRDNPRPQPRPIPQATPPTPRLQAVPAAPPPPEPATAFPRPAAARDLGRIPGDTTDRRQPEPSLPVALPEPHKPGRAGPLIAAAAVVAAICLGVWLVLPTDSNDEPRGTSTPETVQQDSTEPAPPPVAEEPAPPAPPVQAPPPTAPPRGCYPFQPNC
ncbi:hypothetical protein IU459_36930 [Nocardia amamiensis]|uniref:Uncharacterized protein n=1 Tax=Nocardia amamiensis TaxID=404578 RepID=A0ABS0D2H4_9NOCA|nr:hypothetical protein [Nocardia amamiensis]MBF6303046.1 hypothetical protein [Nocardia amamiensis]